MLKLTEEQKQAWPSMSREEQKALRDAYWDNAKCDYCGRDQSSSLPREIRRLGNTIFTTKPDYKLCCNQCCLGMYKKLRELALIDNDKESYTYYDEYVGCYRYKVSEENRIWKQLGRQSCK